MEQIRFKCNSIMSVVSYSECVRRICKFSGATAGVGSHNRDLKELFTKGACCFMRMKEISVV